MKNNLLVSIVTPTFNRKETLIKCYESLISQTVFSFEWIIVDDGSTDGTKEIINEFKNNKFNMTYYYKENGGKHTAINCVKDKIKGKYVLILDSDDILTNDAINTILLFDKKYTNSDIGGFMFLKGYFDGTVTGDEFLDEEKKDYISYRINNNINGDKLEVIKSNIFKQYSFPEIENERFIGEAVIWIPIGLKHKLVFINVILYLCEYLEDGLSKQINYNRVRNPIGGMYHSLVYFDKKINTKYKFKNGILYNMFKIIAKKNKLKYPKRNNVYIFFTKPLGYLLYLKWKKYL